MHQNLFAVLLFSSSFIQFFRPAQGQTRLSGKIVGGTQADIHDFPYQVSIRENGDHVCGGAIVGQATVLTAAHCFTDLPLSEIKVLVGTRWSTSGSIYSVAKVWVHSLYNSNTSDYDVALIKVGQPFKFGPTIQPILLPSQNDIAPASQIMTVTGWGYTKESGSTTLILRKVQVPILGRKRCEAMYKDIATITPRMICAGYEAGQKDACQGDSGGPLAANGKLIGIVSWGYGCARPSYPGVYTRVSKFINWINAKNSL